MSELENSLAYAALKQLEGNTDEDIFAGLLLLTKCTPVRLQEIAPKATTLLLKGNRGFLQRLLITPMKNDKDQEQTPSPSTENTPLRNLSQMQCLGLQVTSTLAKCSKDNNEETVQQLNVKLTQTLCEMLQSLTIPHNKKNDNFTLIHRKTLLHCDIEEVLECLEKILVSYPKDQQIKKENDWPINLISLLFQLIHNFPQICLKNQYIVRNNDYDKKMNLVCEKKVEGVEEEEEIDFEEDGNKNQMKQSWNRIGLIINEIILFRLNSLYITEKELLSIVKFVEIDQNEQIKIDKKTLKFKNQAFQKQSEKIKIEEKFENNDNNEEEEEVPLKEDEEEDGVEVDDEEEDVEKMSTLTKLQVVLDYLLFWAGNKLKNPLNEQLRSNLENGEFSKLMRQCVVMGLHGVAPEPIRDSCIQLVAVASKVIGSCWMLETNDNSTTELGSTASLSLKVIGCEVRLVLDESLALYLTDNDGNNDKTLQCLNSKQSLERKRRCLKLLPICFNFIEQIIEILCSYDDDDDGIDSNQGRSGWNNLNSNCLLEMQQSLNGIATTIIEFLNDVAQSNMLSSSSSSSAEECLNPPCLLDLEDEEINRDDFNLNGLKSLCLCSGRCLACWVANDTDALRQNLKDSATFQFLLSLSKLTSFDFMKFNKNSISPQTNHMNNSYDIYDIDSDEQSIDSDDEMPFNNIKTKKEEEEKERINETIININDMDDDIFLTLLPALSTLINEEYGASLLAEMNVHIKCCVYIVYIYHSYYNQKENSLQLEQIIVGGGGGEEEEEERILNNEKWMNGMIEVKELKHNAKLTSMVWALDLLIHMVQLVGSEILSDHDFNDILRNHPCFKALLPCLGNFLRLKEGLLDLEYNSIICVIKEHSLALQNLLSS